MISYYFWRVHEKAVILFFICMDIVGAEKVSDMKQFEPKEHIFYND